MRKIIYLTIVAFLSTGLLQGRAEETDLPFAKLPAPVQSAMKKLVGQFRMTKTTRETEKDGRVIYEVAYENAGKKFEAEVSAEGKLMVIDEELTLSAAPAAVRKTIELATAGGKVNKVEKATEGRKTYYEAEFRKGNDKHEVKVAPDGKVISTE